MKQTKKVEQKFLMNSNIVVNKIFHKYNSVAE